MDNRKKLRMLGWLFTTIIALRVILSLFADWLYYNFNYEMPWMMGVVFSELFILIPPYFYIRKNETNICEAVGFRKIKVSTALLSVLLCIVAYPILTLANLFSQLFVPNVMLQDTYDMFANGFFPIFLASAILAPCVEEFVCRGVFNNQYRKYISVAGSALITGLMFGLLHLNLNQFCYAFVIGIIFALVDSASGSIIPSMIMHAMINTFGYIASVLVVYVSNATGVDMVAQGEAVRTDGTILTTMGILAPIAVVSLIALFPLIGCIANNEGNEGFVKKIFVRPAAGEEDGKRTPSVTVSFIVGVVVAIAVIFEADYIVNLIFNIK